LLYIAAVGTRNRSALHAWQVLCVIFTRGDTHVTARRLIIPAIFLFAFLAGRWSVQPKESVVHAQSPLPSKVWNAPKSWGQFKAVYYDQLLFEDDHGTIRSVYPNSTGIVFTIRRH
jgi:hypothetical protein